MIEIKTAAEIGRMREGGLLLRRVMDDVVSKIAPGVITSEFDATARKLIVDGLAKPAFLGYRGFPSSLCVSINDEVVHGIPGKRELVGGDIVSIDCGLIYQGFYSDMAVTVAVGRISEEANRLMKVTREALDIGIAEMTAGNRIGSVSAAIQHHAESHGYSVVREYTGHGIGREMHESPQAPNFGVAGAGIRLKSGMVIALEPMINAGAWKTRTLKDGWTVVTADGSLSAHYEHTVAVTEDGPFVLTG
ncbi:MAG: type I methionyl aminopeptidase [bacterium]|nr:type I methionyl aminopeptidase [Candidatus Sumerlaeota bacterium]